MRVLSVPGVPPPFRPRAAATSEIGLDEVAAGQQVGDHGPRLALHLDRTAHVEAKHGIATLGTLQHPVRKKNKNIIKVDRL